MDAAMDMLLTRASTGDLQDPAPDGPALHQIVAAGLRAPDHGKLRPWRFVLIRGEARARFADLAVAALQARDPDASPSDAARMRGKLVGPPLILALGVNPTPSPKVPEIEQVMAVAAAAMNMLNAAHALGFAGKWVTGPNAYDPAIAHALGVAQLAGFLYLGTPIGPLPVPRRGEPGDALVEWGV